ncbi:Retrovirus-related Pol polyprotein from transposon TNT 1-94 [Senna tora]|uniref:Retrovirus-related Pol polyprotein from transposon TNT 1-94 n=1 Tax=Senna tora TaxID=362788 RepID=A0A834XJH5_9FABA|nr:Retrovirus-related Pol polyprotein from transposon TNT 1-94 [Senna tora]
MVSSLKLRGITDDPFIDPTQYRSIVGALQYATITRPEISFSVNKVCQFMHNPQNSHWQAVKRILRYLKGTLDHGLHFTSSPSLSLFAFSDADWGSDPDDRRSTTGWCVYLGNNLISWSSKKQAVVARSSIEAEYRGVANVVSEVVWVQSLLSELMISIQGIPRIFCDNMSTVLLSANHILHSWSKHVELDLFFVRERVARREIEVQHISAAEQTADIMTKVVSSSNFLVCRDKLRLVDSNKLSSRGDVRI